MNTPSTDLTPRQMPGLDANFQQFRKEILEGPRMSFRVQLKMYDVLVPIFSGIIIVLNLIIVLSSGLMLRKRQQPRSTFIFLGNVALADMLIGVATLFGQYFPKDTRTEIVCCVQLGLIISATLASVYSIGLIAIDRYLYILNGLQYQRYVSSKRARLMVIGTWVLGIVIGFLPAVGIRNPTDPSGLCWLIIVEPTALILSTVIIGFLPLLLIIVLYGIILKRALGKITEMQHCIADSAIVRDNSSQLRYFRGGIARPVAYTIDADTRNYFNNPNRELEPQRCNLCCCRTRTAVKIAPIYSPSRWKAIKIVVLTTGCFFVTWFPYFLACALYALCDETVTPFYCDSLRVAIASPLAILGLANSLFNPIIYAWWHNGFRESAKKICTGLWRQRVQPTFCRKQKTSTHKEGNILQKETNLNTTKTSLSSTVENQANYIATLPTNSNNLQV